MASQAPKKILVINTFGIGDVLFTFPLVRNLKLAHPSAQVTYISNRRTSVLAAAHPDVSQVMVYERDDFYELSKSNYVNYFQKWYGFVQSIRDGHFDWAFDFSLNTTFGRIGFLCGIPVRVGYDYKRRGLFLTHRVPLRRYEGKHVVEHHLGLLGLVDVPVLDRTLHLDVGSAEQAWAKEWLKGEGIRLHKPVVAVIPGGGASWGKKASAKQWPPEKFAQLVDKIIADSGATVILFGDANERQLCQEIARLASFPLHFAVGQTSLMQLAAILKSCSLAVVNDGGPLHVAAAVGTPTVSIFGPVDDVAYGPYGPGHQVAKQLLPCQPCYRYFRVPRCIHTRCLRDLSVEDVYRKVRFTHERYSLH